jgi:WD40 repeat protein
MTTRLGKTNQIVFVPGTDLVVTLGTQLKLWREHGAASVAQARPLAHPSSMALSPDARLLAVKNTAGQIVVLSMPDLALVRKLPTPGHEEGSPLLFSPCGEFLVDGSWAGRLVVRSVKTGEVMLEERRPRTMYKIFLQSDDRRRFLYLRSGKTEGDEPPPPTELVLREWPFEQHAGQPIPGDWRFVQAMALSPDGRRLAVLRLDGSGAGCRVDVTDLSGKVLRRSENFALSGTNPSAAWSPDGQWIACVQRGKVRMMDAATLKEAGGHADAYPCHVSFSPDGVHVALGSWEQGTVLPVSQVLAGSTLPVRPKKPRTRAQPARGPALEDQLPLDRIAIFHDAVAVTMRRESFHGTREEGLAWADDKMQQPGLYLMFLGTPAQADEAKPHLDALLEAMRKGKESA